MEARRRAHEAGRGIHQKRPAYFEIRVDGGIELDRIHCFTNDCEAEASLRLRRGDAGVTRVYDAHGRLHGGTRTLMETEAVTAWRHTRQRGQTALLAAPTTEIVERLNQRAQQLLVDTGQLHPAGGYLAVGPSSTPGTRSSPAATTEPCAPTRAT